MLCHNQEVHDVVADIWIKHLLCGLDIPDARFFFGSGRKKSWIQVCMVAEQDNEVSVITSIISGQLLQIFFDHVMSFVLVLS